jgi:ATP adenylyltransferase
VDAQQLWAPWRLDYITGAAPPPEPPTPRSWQPAADPRCFLCRAAAEYAAAEAARRELLVVHVGRHTVVLLNRYPYNNGHLLVSPLRHEGELSGLRTEEHLEAMELLAGYTGLYRELLRAEGFNIGLNLGRAAGAGAPDHLHWHLVPRWRGDGNFMAAVAATRVIPQSLDVLWHALTAAGRGISGTTERP